jgi:N-acetylglucosamine kinase-like BadF-type ATPase
MPLLLADLGGTHVRLREVGRDGETISQLQETGSGLEDGSVAAALGELSTVLRRSSGRSRDKAEETHFIIASRGFRPGGALQAQTWSALRQIASSVQATRVTLVPDGVASYLACLGHRAGVVITVGTGTVAVIVDRRGVAHKMDGLGPQLGERPDKCLPVGGP